MQGANVQDRVRAFLGSREVCLMKPLVTVHKRDRVSPEKPLPHWEGSHSSPAPISHALTEIRLEDRAVVFAEPFLLTGREGRGSSTSHRFFWVPAQQRMPSNPPSLYWFTKGLFLWGVFWLRGVYACNITAFIFWRNCSVIMAFLGGKKFL